jgi:hypothetical protein
VGVSQAGTDGTVFRLYDRVEHTPEPAIDDLVEFHRRSIAGEPAEELGGSVEADPGGGAGTPPEASLDVRDAIEAGEPVTLDASQSTVYDGSLQAFA